MASFPERLKELRINRGLSQQKLSDCIGTISKSSINMYERGDREPSLETMEAFADFFNVDIDYLYGKSDIPNRSIIAPKNNSSASGPSKISLSSKETALVIAYRSKPDMQPAVDKLLGLDTEAAAFPKQA